MQNTRKHIVDVSSLGNQVRPVWEEIPQTNDSTNGEHPRIARPSDEDLDSSDSLKFCRDVHPDQKHYYVTDMFNGTTGKDTNGRLCRLQGVKIDEQIKNRITVLPEIWVKF